MCTKGALKHKFPLKNLELCTHTFGNFFFFNMREDFFCTTFILITYKKKNLYRTIMRFYPDTAVLRKIIFRKIKFLKVRWSSSNGWDLWFVCYKKDSQKIFSVNIQHTKTKFNLCIFSFNATYSKTRTFFFLFFQVGSGTRMEPSWFENGFFLVLFLFRFFFFASKETKNTGFLACGIKKCSIFFHFLFSFYEK